MVGLTPYMRCAACRRVMTLPGIAKRHGCVCGENEFVNCNPMWWERFACWLFHR